MNGSMVLHNVFLKDSDCTGMPGGMYLKVTIPYKENRYLMIRWKVTEDSTVSFRQGKNGRELFQHGPDFLPGFSLQAMR